MAVEPLWQKSCFQNPFCFNSFAHISVKTNRKCWSFMIELLSQNNPALTYLSIRFFNDISEWSYILFTWMLSLSKAFQMQQLFMQKATFWSYDLKMLFLALQDGSYKIQRNVCICCYYACRYILVITYALLTIAVTQKNNSLPHQYHFLILVASSNVNDVVVGGLTSVISGAFLRGLTKLLPLNCLCFNRRYVVRNSLEETIGIGVDAVIDAWQLRTLSGDDLAQFSNRRRSCFIIHLKRRSWRPSRVDLSFASILARNRILARFFAIWLYKYFRRASSSSLVGLDFASM